MQRCIKQTCVGGNRPTGQITRFEQKRKARSRSRGQFSFNPLLIKRKSRSFISKHSFVLARDFNN